MEAIDPMEIDATRVPASKTSATDMSCRLQPGGRGEARMRYTRKIIDAARIWAKTLAVSVLATSGVLGAVLLAPASPVSAASATITAVTLYASPSGSASSGCTTPPSSSSTDSTICSLHNAIAVAEGSTYSGSAVTIVLEHTNGNICSTSADCIFAGDQTISGGSESALTIEGTGTGSNASAATFLNGENSSTNVGTILAISSTTPTVTLNDVTVTGGYNTNGGGIANTGGGTVNVTDSTISGNSASNTTSSAYGGGIANTGDGTVNVTDSTISANSSNDGGGIYNFFGNMTVVDSTISGNSADYGGGIYNNATMTVADSTISDNSAPVYGGGIFNNNGGTMTVADSTISANNAGYSGRAGGGIYNWSGGTMTVAGSIVASQSSGGNCDGSVTDAGYNLSDGTFCFGSTPSSTGNISNATLNLGTLGNYGGQTETVPLGDGSAAGTFIATPATVTFGTTTVDLCGGSSTASENSYGGANLSLDQRGVNRPSTGCSAGAYQITVPLAPTGLTVTPGNGSVTLRWAAPTNDGGFAITGYDVYEGTTTGGETTTPVNGTTAITGTSYTVTGLANGTTYYFTVEAINSVGNSVASSEASATPAEPTILFATPNGTGTSGCATNPTSTSTSQCSLAGAISAAGSLTDDSVVIELEYSNGSSCSASSVCAFIGTQSVTSGKEASLTIEGTGTGSGSSADSVLNGNNLGTTFTDSATFPVTLDNVEVTGGKVVSYTIGRGVFASTGGGIYNYGTMTVADSTISGNTAITDLGGGIYNHSGTMTVTDSTISGNKATSSGARGGGIYNYGTMTVTGSTISGNTSGGYGGGIYNNNPATLAGTIVAGNTATSGDNGCAAGGGYTITDAGYNLSNGTSCGFGTASPVPPGSKDSASLDLATALARNGGPTKTIALGSASAANTAISSPSTATAALASVNLCSDTSFATASGFLANLALDQRGVNRPSTGCSAGAYQITTAPVAPTGLTATPGISQAALSWNAPIYDGGSSITGYNVYEGTSTGVESGTPLVSTAPDITTYTATGLSPGTTYYFTVKAVNRLGNSAASNQALATVEGPPGITSASSTNFTVDTSNTFTVTTSTNEYPTPSLVYTGATLPSGVSFVDNANGTATLSGTPALGTVGSYQFTITASNGISPAATQAFTLTVAKASTLFSATASPNSTSYGSSGTLSESGLPSSATGTVTFSSGGSTLCVATLPSNSCVTSTSLAVGNYPVTATYSGDGNYIGSTANTSFTINAVTPEAPSGVTGTSGDNGQSVVSWKAPSSDGGSSISGYTVEYSTTSGGTYTAASTCTNVNALTCTVTGLTNGTSYYFEVEAINSVGTGPLSAASSAATPAATAPPTVTNAPPPSGTPSGSTTILQTSIYTGGQTSISGTSGTSSATVTIPAGDTSLDGATLSLYSLDTSKLLTAPNGNSYVDAFSVSWQSPFGTIPTATLPISISITDPSIKPGDTVYELNSSGSLVPVPASDVTIVGDVITVTFDTEPTCVVSAPSSSGSLTNGYWLVGSDGGVFSFGDANYYGSTGGTTLNKPIVAAMATPDGKGYWLVASDGGVFSFGDASYYGSTGAMTLNKPIVAAMATPDGKGYWLVASDGGVFSFGDAAFYGSTGAMTLNKPIVAAMATPDGKGYWLVGSDGGVFSFGDASYYGSTGAMTLNKPIVAAMATPDGKGYWLVGSDGGVFSFGDAAFYGSTGAMALNKPIVGSVIS